MITEIAGLGQTNPVDFCSFTTHRWVCWTHACLIEATQQVGILYRPEQGSATHILWMRPVAEFDDRVQTPNGTVRRFNPA